jgi:hypothetical protein
MRFYGVNDGYDRFGFPFTFRAMGGIAGTYEFSYLALLADIAFAILAGLTVGYVRTGKCNLADRCVPKCNLGARRSESLSDDGNLFASKYFDFETGKYLSDYCAAVGINIHGIYYASDTWENFDRLKPVLDERYAEWKKKRD